jgi:type II secretory pathway pseudopilin PulG
MRKSSRGFMILDAVIGTAVLGTIVLVLAIGMRRERLAADGLSQSRRAIRAAEAALARLQAGRQAPVDSDGATLQVHDVAAAGAPRGYHWVEVQATAGEQHETLVGLVRTAPAGRRTP